MRLRLLFIILLLLSAQLPHVLEASSFSDSFSSALTSLPETQLTIGDKRLKVEVAATYEAMARGLMFRNFLASDAGMLFVFPTEHQASFWMKNTSLPLSIAYIDLQGKILEIHALIPFEEKPVVAKSSKVFYALEVNRDWFNLNNIKPGMQIKGLPTLKLSQ